MPFQLATAFAALRAKNENDVGGAAAAGEGPGAPGSPGLPAAGPLSTTEAAQQAAQGGPASLSGLAGKMQQAAGNAEYAAQQLAAQQQAAGHLGALVGTAQGGGLRVRIVAAQPAQW